MVKRSSASYHVSMGETPHDRTQRSLQLIYPELDIWYVDRACTLDITWHFKPKGAPRAVGAAASDIETLVTQIERWLHRTPCEVEEHVKALRMQIDALPAHMTREHAHLTACLAAESVTVYQADNGRLPLPSPCR